MEFEKEGNKTLNYLFIGFLIVALAAMIIDNRSYTGNVELAPYSSEMCDCGTARAACEWRESSQTIRDAFSAACLQDPCLMAQSCVAPEAPSLQQPLIEPLESFGTPVSVQDRCSSLGISQCYGGGECYMEWWRQTTGEGIGRICGTAPCSLNQQQCGCDFDNVQTSDCR